MEKEVKVGLTIIFVLLITFVGVLTKKMYSSHAAAHSLTVSEENLDETMAAGETITEKFAKMPISKKDIAPASHPTVVAATAVSGKPPLSPTSESDQWNTVSDGPKTISPAEKASALTPPPSFMPVPGKNLHTVSRVDNTGYNSSVGADDSTSNRYCAARTYTVAEGDSLYDIARSQLGKAWRWAEIYELNRDVLGNDLDCLTPGVQIVLPEGKSPLPPGEG